VLQEALSTERDAGAREEMTSALAEVIGEGEVSGVAGMAGHWQSSG
jgi:hypothetical protein